MKVVYIHHASSYGGSSRSLGILLPRLMELGVEPHIICPKGLSSQYFKKITPNVYTASSRAFPLLMTVAAMKNNGFHFFRNLAMKGNVKGIIELVKTINPDLVHFNELGLSMIAKDVKKLGIPIVMHARTMPHKGFPRLNKYANDKIREYCDHLICITGSVSNWLVGIENKSIIYNPIEFIPSRMPFAKNKKPLVFLSLSAIQKSKGVYDIAEAAKILLNDNRVIFRIAGRISLKENAKLSFKQKLMEFFGILDFNAAQRLLDFIKENKLDNLELLGHVDDIHSVLKDTDVMLAPMHLNAPPRSVYEAGKYGIPSILSMEDKVEDVIKNEESGIIIDEESPEQLVSAIRKFLDNPNLIEEYGNKARERIIVNHNQQINAKKVLDVYISVLSKYKSKKS